MPYLLQVDFPYSGPWGEQMTAAMRELAQSIAGEPGPIWKRLHEAYQQAKAA